MMMSKGITFLAQTGIFNNKICEWIRQTIDQKTWEKDKLFFQQSHREKRRAVTTAEKVGYTATVQNIYDAPPPPPEDHHEAIEYIQTIVQGMQTQSYHMEGISQANSVLTISKSAVMS